MDGPDAADVGGDIKPFLILHTLGRPILEYSAGVAEIFLEKSTRHGSPTACSIYCLARPGSRFCPGLMTGPLSRKQRMDSSYLTKTELMKTRGGLRRSSSVTFRGRTPRGQTRTMPGVPK
jgi:hypothetical protein